LALDGGEATRQGPQPRRGTPTSRPGSPPPPDPHADQHPRAGRHGRQDVELALIRLTVTERVEETGGRYRMAAAEAG